jgi:hypothetical protein
MTCNDCGRDIDRCICGAFSRFKTDPEEAQMREFFAGKKTEPKPSESGDSSKHPNAES